MGDFINAILSFFTTAAPYIQTGSELGQLGTQAYGLANPSGSPGMNMPQQMGFQAPHPSQDQMKSMTANRQTQGLYTGGAASPESLAALFGNEGYDPSFIQQLFAASGSNPQQQQQQGGSALG